MKVNKIFLVLIVTVLVISCKKEEIGITTKNTGLLLSQITVNDQPTLQYTYNASKLITAEISKYDLTQYNYDGSDKLAGTNYYLNYNILSSDAQVATAALSANAWVTPDNANQAGSGAYEFDGTGLLSKVTYNYPSGSSQHSEFVYDSNGRISKQILFWDNSETGHIDYAYDSKGNLIEEDLFNVSSDGSDELSTTTAYEFDNQKNPYKDISKLLIPGIYTNANNITKITYTIAVNSDQSTASVQVISNTYEYNSKGYPVSMNGNTKYIYI